MKDEIIVNHYAELDQIAEEIGVPFPPRNLRSVDLTTAASRSKALAEVAIESVDKAAKGLDALVVAGPDEPLAPSSDELAAAQGKLSASLAGAGLTLQEVQEQLGALGAEASSVLQRLVNWLLAHVIRVISKVASRLRVDSWTVGVTGGFPAGVNVSITVTFT